MGKWRCRPKKVYKFLWEIFVAARKKKSLKSCWWFPGELPFYSGAKFFFILSGEVLVDPAWESWESCGSRLLLHPPPLLDLLLLDLPLLDLLHRKVVTLIHFSLTFRNIEKKKVNFLRFLHRLPEHLVLHEIKNVFFTYLSFCYTWRFIHLPTTCTSQQTLPGHLTFFSDLAVSLASVPIFNMLFVHTSLKKAWHCFICRLLGAMLFYMVWDCHLFFPVSSS